MTGNASFNGYSSFIDEAMTDCLISSLKEELERLPYPRTNG